MLCPETGGRSVSVSLDGTFCVAALDWELQRARSEIFNSDQDAQFTSVTFTGRLEQHGILISMDGRGRALDNVFVERLWRTVKYEDIYLKDYSDVAETVAGLRTYLFRTVRPVLALRNSLCLPIRSSILPSWPASKLPR